MPSFPARFASRRGLEKRLRLEAELNPTPPSEFTQLDAGRFPTAEDAVRYAVNQAKRCDLSATLEASHRRR
jgi:hypothetical protein